MGMALAEILHFEKPIYAHTDSKACEGKETLAEHTSRCQKYFSRLLAKEKLRDAFGAMEPVLTGGDCADWFWQALEDIVIFHDVGKINPVFQQKAMANAAFDGVCIPNLEEQAHSPLSAYIYFDYHAAQTERFAGTAGLGNDKKLFLYEILCVNAYLIMKHHSDLGSLSDFVSAIDENGKLSNIDEQVLKGCYSQLYRGKYSKHRLPRYVKLLRNRKDSEERKFAKYTYARLAFSVLIACDYYATNEYITGTEVNYFGSVKEVGDLRRAFEGTRRMESIRQFHPETAVDDGKDINYLRNMLFYEVERNLEKHVGEDIFFLEAPTGCGKSNVGFQCSFRLVQEGMGKIVYVYPFNNLVEQNRASIEEMFQGKGILEHVAVVQFHNAD